MSSRVLWRVFLSGLKRQKHVHGRNGVFYNKERRAAGVCARHADCLTSVQAFHKAGIPKGVINIVTGRGSEIGDYLTVRTSCLRQSIACIHDQATPLTYSTFDTF